jgi:hypothetical protein
MARVKQTLKSRKSVTKEGSRIKRDKVKKPKTTHSRSERRNRRDNKTGSVKKNKKIRETSREDDAEKKTELGRLRSERNNKKMSAMRCKLSHDKYAKALWKQFESPASSAGRVRIFKNGLDRDANLARAGIPRAQKRLMLGASNLADRFCKNLSRRLLAMMVAKAPVCKRSHLTEKDGESGNKRNQRDDGDNDDNDNKHGNAIAYRIMGKHVEEALGEMGCKCLFP